MTKKKPEPNPIEKAIGNRAKMTKDIPPIVNNKEFQKLAETQDKPSPSEMATLEELNIKTEERLQDQYEEPMTEIPITTATGKRANVPQAAMPPQKTLVSKPDPQPVAKTSSPESPPQETNPDVLHGHSDDHQKHVEQYNKTADKIGIPKITPTEKKDFIETVDRVVQEEFPPVCKKVLSEISPAEDIEFTALKKYILEDGFVLATVAFHIVSLCAEPLTTPSTTMWDFKDRAQIPDMVLALLNQPGYLEGIWPSLKIVMSDNIGNAAWCAGIATTIAFFDVIRTLPALKELQNEA